VDGPVEKFDAGVIRTESHRVNKTRALSIGKGRAVPEVIRTHRIDGIENTDSLIEILLSRLQRYSHRPLYPLALLEVVDFKICRAVRIFTQDRIDRRKNRDRVSVRSGVPFDAAADPGAAHRDHPRLYHIIEMEHLLALGFVENRMQPAAQFRKTGDFQVFILQKQCFVRSILPGSGKIVLHRVRIDNRTFDRGGKLDLAFERP